MDNRFDHIHDDFDHMKAFIEFLEDQRVKVGAGRWYIAMQSERN